LQGLSDFIARHWGDSIGLYMIHLGIVLTVVGGFYGQLSTVQHVGESFHPYRRRHAEAEIYPVGQQKRNPENPAPAPIAPPVIIPTTSDKTFAGCRRRARRSDLYLIAARVKSATRDCGDLGTNSQQMRRTSFGARKSKQEKIDEIRQEILDSFLRLA